MKLFNLTDIETPQLKELGLVNQNLVAGRVLLAPGQASGEIGEDALTRQHLAHYVTVGAMSEGVLPPQYLVAKAQQARAKAAEQQKAPKEKK